MIFQSPGAIELPIQVKSATKQETMLASFGHDGDGEVSVASELRGLCVRDASDEDTSALVASAADAGGYGGLLDEEELAGQAEAAGEEDDDDERRWLREAFRMYEMEGAGCITPLSLKLVLARLGAHRDIAECRFDLDGDGVLSFDEFRTMMIGASL
jgi:calcium-binding protein CML